MKFTEHAMTRMAQRNFSDEIIEMILDNGRTTHAPGGAIKVFFWQKRVL